MPPFVPQEMADNPDAVIGIGNTTTNIIPGAKSRLISIRQSG
jgi:hypothetical protein